MYDGHIMGELSPSVATEESILMMATGHNSDLNQTKEKPLAS
jgi:hypothetical protein